MVLKVGARKQQEFDEMRRMKVQKGDDIFAPGSLCILFCVPKALIHFSETRELEETLLLCMVDTRL